MSDQSGPDTNLSAYRQRRRVELLRQQLHSETEAQATQQLLAELAEAEESLHKLEALSADKEAASSDAVLMDISTADDAGGFMLGPEARGVEVQALKRQSHIPTGIVHLLEVDETPLVTFKLRAMGDQSVRLRLVTFVEGYSAQAISTVELDPEKPQEVNHLPTFFPEHIRWVNELTRASLNVRVDDLEGTIQQHRTFPIWMLARTSAYNGIKDPATGEWIDLSRYLAAWVTPGAQEVLRLLRRAAELHPQRRIAGYQVDAAGVQQQAKAIFEALKAEEILYVNSIVAFGSDRDVTIQRVRLPRQSIRSKSANCIDGTVLMASVLEAASLSPGIVLVPGHAFVAWRKEQDGDEWEYLETTMIATHDFEAACLRGKILAEQYGMLAERSGDGRYFRLLSLANLRVNEGITPME
jgi:hypothetical protein